jgi:glutathione synthase/RimK-type ligase-like ATP-grasp enzyme
MVHHLISAWAEYTPALVISRPSAEGTNQSKLYQAGEIRASGFLTPESLVTNDPAAVREFQALHGSLIYKSMSNVRSVVKELAVDDLEGKVLGPVLFQQRIVGQNVRVHVVGEECFACAIETEGTDYRYAPSRMTKMTLPGDVADKAVALTRRLGLYLAGLDFIVTPAGEWYCLEANPNPAFACFADGDEVAQAVARLLMEAPEPERRQLGGSIFEMSL